MTGSTAPTAVATDPLLVPRVVEVVDVAAEMSDVTTLRLAPVAGSFPPFEPAQVCMVGAFGVGEAAISISSSPAETDHWDVTIRRVGAITGALTALAPGDQLWVRGPFGTPWDLDLGGRDVLVVAGGIGLAPLRSAVYTLLDRLDEVRSATLLVGARSAGQVLYRDEFGDWRRRGLAVETIIDRPEDGWDGPVGFVPQLVADIDIDPGRTSAMICGPDVMMRLTADVLVGRGVDAADVQLTLERNMQCGNGLCGHCQLGPLLVCRDGPVVRYPAVSALLPVEEL